MEIAREMDPASRRKAIIIGVVILAYFIAMIHFSFHFYPNSTIGAVEVSGLTVGEAASALDDAVSGYELKVEGENGVSFTVMSHEAGLTLDTEDIARQAMSANPGILWPIELLLPHDHSDAFMASAGEGGFRDKISDAVKWYNQNATPPKDATIKYDEGGHTFKIEADERGNTLDEEKITEHVVQALAVMQPVLVLGDDDYKQPSVKADDQRLQQALEKAQTTLNTNLTFKAHNKEVGTLTGETAAKWVMTDDNVQIVLDEDQLNAWVQDLADKSSTVGVKRTWTREDGVQCTVEGGVYGWEADWLAIDSMVHEAVLSGSTKQEDIPMVQEAAAYNGEHGRDWKSYIDVDLDEQHAVYYDDNGKVLWQAYFVSGTPDGKHNTPQGVYVINNKESPSLLVGDSNGTGSPEYQTTVQYWMPWHENDVGFHDADWQDSFGGTRYEDGFGSHGCINLSPDDAASLYKLASVGVVVVCHGSGASTVEEQKSSSDDQNQDSEERSSQSSDTDSSQESESESHDEESSSSSSSSHDEDSDSESGEEAGIGEDAE